MYIHVFEFLANSVYVGPLPPSPTLHLPAHYLILNSTETYLRPESTFYLLWDPEVLCTQPDT